MKRRHLPELEDMACLPDWLRDDMTAVLVALGQVIGVPEVLALLVRRVAEEQSIEGIVDLGSGSGGAMPALREALREDPETAGLRVTMSDLRPNAEAIARFSAEGDPQLVYDPQPVDATHVESAPDGLKTMVNSFHHMRPEQARAILASAQQGKQPLLVYEMGDNRIPFAVWLLALPIGLAFVFLSCFLLTPMVRPLSARQLLLTYLIPIIPLCYAWDGQASMPRIYSPGDLDELIESLPPDAGYRWEHGPALNAAGKVRGLYLLGMPVG